MKRRMTQQRKADAAATQAAGEAMQTAKPASARAAKATDRKYRATLAQLEVWYGADAVLRDDYRTIMRRLEESA